MAYEKLELAGLSDEELILKTMGWAKITAPCWPLDLDSLREVEGTLTKTQWDRYNGALELEVWPDGQHPYWKTNRVALQADIRIWIVHASAEQKIKALAQVLREGR